MPSDAASVASAVAASHPDRARQLADAAEGLARSIDDSRRRAWALADVARALATSDPDRAEQIARSIRDPERQASALSAVAAALGIMDPIRAERLVCEGMRGEWTAFLGPLGASSTQAIASLARYLMLVPADVM